MLSVIVCNDLYEEDQVRTVSRTTPSVVLVMRSAISWGINEVLVPVLPLIAAKCRKALLVKVDRVISSRR